MPLCTQVNADGFLQATATSAQECTSYVLVDANEYALMLMSYDISASSIAAAFTWGFGTYISFWFFPYCVKSARKVINLL